MSSSRNDLVAMLRSRLSDDRANVSAFSIQVTGNCKTAFLDVASGFLTVSVEGGNGVSSLRWSLALPPYATVGRLLESIRRLPGYTVVADAALSKDFPSIGLQVEGYPDISNGKSYTLKHFVFSDSELSNLLVDAIALHNPNYTIQTVPRDEYPYVLMKASAAAYRALAVDATRRKSLDSSAEMLLSLAQDAERQYDSDVRRMQRIIPRAKADEHSIGAGDVIQGMFSRPSLRTGEKAPARVALPPSPPDLYQPSDDDVEDVLVRLRWQAARDSHFARYEIWRDSVPTVERSLAGRSGTSGVPTSTPWSKATTSILIANGIVGQLTSNDGFVFGLPFEQGTGQSVANSSFVDGLNPDKPLEPESTYYYRLYLVNQNGEILPSDVVRVATKVRRARFKRTAASMASDAVAPVTGPVAGGTEFVILGTNFVSGMKVYLNGKECAQSALTSTQVDVTSPGQTNDAFVGKALDLVLVSPTGLKDIYKGVWTYTA
jgi:hypothetical protein